MLNNKSKRCVVPALAFLFLGVLFGVFLGMSVAPTIQEEFVWRKSLETDTTASYAGYMKGWPEGRHIAEATAAYDERSWRGAEVANSISGYQEYIARNPKGQHLSEAKIKIASFHWQEAIAANTVSAFERYLQRHRDDPNAAEAETRIESLHWQEAAAVDTTPAYETFLKLHPDSAQIAEANQRMDSLDWQQAYAGKTIPACEQYLRRRPAGAYVEDARKLMEVLRLQDAPSLSGDRKLEGEDGFLLDESSRQATRAYRSNASGGETLHLGKGDALVWYFATNEKKSYHLTLRYANDSSADNVAFFYDSKKIGECRTTVLATNRYQWNSFDDCAQIGMITLTPGRHALRLEVVQGDRYGIDIDYVSLAERGAPKKMARPRLEAEDATPGSERSAREPSVSGIAYRNGASDLAAMHLAKGDTLSWSISTSGNKSQTYSLLVRYSNDGAADTLTVSVDGKQVGECVTDPTVVWAGLRAAHYWDEYRTCGPIPVVLTSGKHDVHLAVAASDPHGVEVDYIEIDNAEQQPERESGR